MTITYKDYDVDTQDIKITITCDVCGCEDTDWLTEIYELAGVESMTGAQLIKWVENNGRHWGDCEVIPVNRPVEID